MIYRVYPAVFEVAEEGGYTVHFPDLSGCYTEGDTIEEAYKYAKEALHLYLCDMAETPRPTGISDVERNQSDLVMLIEADEKDDVLYYSNAKFAKSFEDALANKGYTKYQVAKILGVDKAYIGRIAKGDRSPSVDMAKRIGALLALDWRVFYPNKEATN
jgi:predicted RNase H-like HicB family nuclease/DNA-binding XRE family transcriptional regulator